MTKRFFLTKQRVKTKVLETSNPNNFIFIILTLENFIYLFAADTRLLQIFIWQNDCKEVSKLYCMNMGILDTIHNTMIRKFSTWYGYQSISNTGTRLYIKCWSNIVLKYWGNIISNASSPHISFIPHILYLYF